MAVRPVLTIALALLAFPAASTIGVAQQSQGAFLGSGQTVQQNPRWGGYHYNELGYGTFTPGPDGGFGGYPPGSAQAEELRNQQRYRCQAVPEQC